MVSSSNTAEYEFPVYSSQTKSDGLLGYFDSYLYENAITWTTDGANAGTVHYRDGKFYCTNVCGVLLNEDGYANRCTAAILGSVSKKYVSYVGNPKLMNNIMSEIPIVIPSLKEQYKIDSLIAVLDKRIKAQQMIISHLKKYKRGVMSVLLSSKDNPYYSSETWEEVSLCDVASGFEYGMNAAATIYDGSHRYIRITDIDDSSHLYIQDELVSPEGQVEEKYRVRENDILFARTGASVGKSYCYQRSDGNLYFAGFLIRIHINSDVDCSYVFQNTLTEAYRRWVMLESARSGQPGINAEQYKQYRFLLPPIETQKKISFLASNLDTLISKGESLLSQLEQTKAALLQQLFI